MHQRNFIFLPTYRGGGIKSHKVENKKLSPEADLPMAEKNFDNIISIENLFTAWQEFKKGKIKKKDVQLFVFSLEDNLFQLHRELKNKLYQHSKYTAFNISDPKPRKIHKATVRDRILHHAVFRILYPIFDKSFIFDSYSCRIEKGTHKAVSRLELFCRKLNRNNRRNIYVLKCDIKKFFASVNQKILVDLIKKKIQDKNAIWLIEKIIKSFNSGIENKGIPLGNVTSQLFANIYLNEFDQFVKHKLKIKYYLRYCDDFLILGENEESLKNLIKPVDNFLKKELKLRLHPDKIIVRKLRQGVDFLGYVVLPYHRVLRTKTKRRMFNKLVEKRKELKNSLISKQYFNQSLQSYLGVLKHCKGYKVLTEINRIINP